MKTLAKFGLWARGAVYFLVGALAFLLAAGRPEGRATDSKGALQQLLSKPFGTIILAVIGVGLLCYAVWRIFEAVKNPEHHPRNWKGWGVRAGRFLAGLIHVGLGFYALNLIFWFSREAGKSGGEQKAAREVLSLPFGGLLLAAIGVGILTFGLSQFWIAYREKFLKTVALPERRLMPVCKFGISARGLVFALVGGFFVQAAVYHDPHEAGGVKQAWLTLQKQPFGDLLIAIVALGLIAFAIYSAIEATHRRTV